jgi:hypothetical protein
VDDKTMSIRRLRQLLFGDRTETTESAVGADPAEPGATGQREGVAGTEGAVDDGEADTAGQYTGDDAHACPTRTQFSGNVAGRFNRQPIDRRLFRRNVDIVASPSLSSLSVPLSWCNGKANK